MPAYVKKGPAKAAESVPVDVPDEATPLEPAEPTPAPQVFGSTFAERAAARAAAEAKAVKAGAAENKAVAPRKVD